MIDPSEHLPERIHHLLMLLQENIKITLVHAAGSDMNSQLSDIQFDADKPYSPS